MYLLIIENIDYEEGTSTITENDAAASVDAELNKSPESSDNISTAATWFEGKYQSHNYEGKYEISITALTHLYLLIIENMDYEEGTSTTTKCDAAASGNAELNKSPGSSDVSTAATGFEGKLEKQTL